MKRRILLIAVAVFGLTIAVLWIVLTFSTVDDRSVRAHKGHLTAMAFSPDGAVLVTASDDRTISLWNASDWSNNTNLAATAPVEAVAINREGKLLATGESNGEIELWDLNEHRQMTTLRGHKGVVKSVAFSSDQRTLASADDEGSVIVWSLMQMRKDGEIATHGGGARVGFLSDGLRLAVATATGHFDIYDTHSLSMTDTFKGEKNAFLSLDVSPDGQLIATGNVLWDVQLWDVAQAQERSRLRGHSTPVSAVAFSPHGNILASGSWGTSPLRLPEIRLWQTQSGKTISVHKTKTLDISCLCFSRDGNYLVFGSNDGSFCVWKVP